MLVRSFSTACSNGDIGESANRAELGIYDARRTIYVFVDRPSYEAKNFVKVKVAIINECAYDDSKCLTGTLHRANSIVLRKGVYFGSIICGIPGNVTSSGSFFVLDNSLSSEKNILPSVDVISHGQNLYSTKMNSVSIEDSLCMGIEFETKTLPPQYYTEYMMFKDAGDYCDIRQDYSYIKTPMDVLFDGSTKIQFMDIANYDTMRFELTGSLVKVESNHDSSLTVPISIGSAFNSFEGSGSIFMYDSDAFGIGKEGVNVKGGYYPQGKFYDKPWLANNLSNALDFFRLNCKDIEDMYGHVRVLYSPDAIGNKYKIRFKDYKTSPIVPLGKIDNNGNVDETKSNAVTSGLDTGYSTDRAVVESIDLVNKSKMRDFMRETQGW